MLKEILKFEARLSKSSKLPACNGLYEGSSKTRDYDDL
jgi:hypothetical protein